MKRILGSIVSQIYPCGEPGFKKGHYPEISKFTGLHGEG
jgi:hypothetical protein